MANLPASSPDDLNSAPQHDEARDTIPDRESQTGEERSEIKEVKAVDRLISMHRRWYSQHNLVISDNEIAEFKFRFRLFNILRREFLKPIVTAILADQPKDQIQQLAIQQSQAYLSYLKLLNAPEYLTNLSPGILIELETVALITNWENLNSLATLRDQLREILGIPKPDPDKFTEQT